MVTGMSRTLLGFVALLMMAAGCAKPPVTDTAAGTGTSIGPESSIPPLSPHPPGGVVFQDDGKTVVEACGLVSAERIGEVFGVSEVQARESMRPVDGNHVGTCDYTTGTFALNLSVRMSDPTLSAAEFVKGATYGKGQMIDGLGSAAALAKFDDGVGQLVVVQDQLLLLLTGANEITHGFVEVGKEALPGLQSL